MKIIEEISPRKIRVSRLGVALFNAQFPCSELDSNRAYWFEFDDNRDLIDTDVPEHSDGPASAALAEDCARFLFDNETPDWADYPEN